MTGTFEVAQAQHPAEARWWLPEFKGERYKRALDVVRAVRSRQTHWRKRDLLHAHLYGNLPILGFGPNSYSRIEPDDGRLVMNLVKSKIDTYVSLICRSRPEPMFLPVPGGADPGEAWSLRRKCKGLERWAEGFLDANRFHEDIAPLVVLETGIFDYGIAKVLIDGVDGDDWSAAEVKVERAYHWEMVIDDAEALTGQPRNLYQRRWVDRNVLAAAFPSSKAAILACPKTFEEDEWGYDDTSDQVLVTEGWHLPSRRKALRGDDNPEDGLWFMAIANADLQEEGYDDDRFPFALLRQTPAPWGIRGIPIAAQLRPLQVFINQMYLDFQDAVSMMGRPKWLVPRQAAIEKSHLDDDIGTIIEYSGANKPEAYVPPSMPTDAFNLLQDVWKKADEVIGISSYASGGIVPSNFKSGKAQEVANDTRDGRFLISSRLFEAWCMEVVDLGIEKARIVARHRKDFASRWVNKRKAVVIPFRDVDVERAKYSMNCYPASALANTPGARYDQLQDMFDRGLIDMATFRHLLDFPDIEGELKVLNAPEELAARLIERFLDAEDPEDEDVYIAPEPRWPLAKLYERFIYATADAQNDGAPEGNLELLRRFTDQVEDTAKKNGIALPGMPVPGQGPANTAPPASVPGQGPPMAIPGGAPSPAPPQAA